MEWIFQNGEELGLVIVLLIILYYGYNHFVRVVHESEKECEKRMHENTVNFKQQIKEYKEMSTTLFNEYKSATDDKYNVIQESLTITRQDRDRDREEMKAWKDEEKKQAYQIIGGQTLKIEHLATSIEKLATEIKKANN